MDKGAYLWGLGIGWNRNWNNGMRCLLGHSVRDTLLTCGWVLAQASSWGNMGLPRSLMLRMRIELIPWHSMISGSWMGERDSSVAFRLVRLQSTSVYLLESYLFFTAEGSMR